MPRSPKIPHLEYRKSGYVWRRRLPKSLVSRRSKSPYRQAHEAYWHGLDLHATRTTFHHDLMDLSTPGYKVLAQVFFQHDEV